MTIDTLFGDLARFQDGDATQALAGALEAVRGYCGWHIAPVRTETMTLRSPDGAHLFVDTGRLVSVEALSDGTLSADLATVEWDSNGVITRTPGYRYTSRSRAEVVVTHGYETLPADVRQVVLTVAQRSLDTMGSRTRLQTPEITEDFGAAGALVLTDADKATLGPFRIPVC